MKTRIITLIIISFLFFACNITNNDNSRRIIMDNYESVKSVKAQKYLDSGDRENRNENYEVALKYFQKANEVEPNNSLILNSLANIEFLAGEKELSYSHFEKAIALDSTFLSTYVSYGTCLEKNKEYIKAIEILRSGFGKSSKDQFAHYGLAFNLAINYYKIDSCELAKNYVGIALNNKFKNEHFDSETIKIAKIISICNK